MQFRRLKAEPKRQVGKQSERQESCRKKQNMLFISNLQPRDKARGDGDKGN